jgi:hypothetical protein
MKSYLVPGLDGAQRQRLQDAGVIFYEWAGDTLIQEDQLQLALKTLGAATATEEATEYENMFKLALRYRTAEDNRPKQFPGGLDPNSPRGKSRAQYIKICQARVQALIGEAQTAAQNLRNALPAACNAFAQTSRAAAFANGPGDEAKRKAEFVEELSRLREIPQVREVRCLPGALYVYTHKLYATRRDTGSKHDIGEFLIKIRLDGQDGAVRWFNSTRRVNGVRTAMNAPNVYADGKPAADEMIQTFIELVAQCQFAVVAELAIQFIETTNDDEFARTLDRWPVATSGGK